MRLSFLPVLAVLCIPAVAAGQAPRLIALPSSAPLLELKVAVRTGSAFDPVGMEGLASLTAQLLIEGGFGPEGEVVTKEKLAEITRPWGSGAYPSVRVDKELTTFSMTVPREHLKAYVQQVLRPMLAQPRFAEEELERLREESIQVLRAVRLEQIEMAGLWGLDEFIHEGTRYAHPPLGTEAGLHGVTRDAVQAFYRRFYRPDSIILGITSDRPEDTELLRAAFAGLASQDAPPPPPEPPRPVQGRHVRILALPNAISTGIHAGFPIPITRAHPDYWPLYVANIWFGTHRDSFGHLYDEIRAKRGYNYGDYSYIEHFAQRPQFLFPPPNTPRRYQYFSIWIRPVQHEYAHHIMKALTWELEHFVRTGLTEEQVELAKNKARVLYLNLAETTERLLAYRIDDAFYGLEPGYLQGYLQRIDSVTADQVNRAIRRYLQWQNLKYVVVTDDQVAPELARALAADGPAWGKTWQDYQIQAVEEGGQRFLKIPESKLEILQRDAVWAFKPLEISPDHIRIDFVDGQ